MIHTSILGKKENEYSKIMSSFSGLAERNCPIVSGQMLCCCYANVNCFLGGVERKSTSEKREHSSSGILYHIYLSIYLTMSVLLVLQPLGPKSIEMS